MTIELHRHVESQTPTRDESRSYYSGIDTERLPAAYRRVTPDGRECGIEPRHFWFTFCGQRYHALAYIYFWVNRERISDNAHVSPPAGHKEPASSATSCDALITFESGCGCGIPSTMTTKAQPRGPA